MSAVIQKTVSLILGLSPVHVFVVLICLTNFMFCNFRKRNSYVCSSVMKTANRSVQFGQFKDQQILITFQVAHFCSCVLQITKLSWWSKEEVEIYYYFYYYYHYYLRVNNILVQFSVASPSAPFVTEHRGLVISSYVIKNVLFEYQIGDRLPWEALCRISQSLTIKSQLLTTIASSHILLILSFTYILLFHANFFQ